MSNYEDMSNNGIIETDGTEEVYTVNGIWEHPEPNTSGSIHVLRPGVKILAGGEEYTITGTIDDYGSQGGLTYSVINGLGENVEGGIEYSSIDDIVSSAGGRRRMRRSRKMRKMRMSRKMRKMRMSRKKRMSRKTRR
jgi:hypothetical protein